MKWTVARKIINQDGRIVSPWKNYIVKTDKRSLHISYNTEEKRFADNQDIRNLIKTVGEYTDLIKHQIIQDATNHA